MITKKIEWFDINEMSGGFTTMVDTPKQNENFPTEIRGFRNFTKNVIGERDYGAKNRIPVPPIRPNAGIAITGCASNGGPNLIRVTATAHGFNTNDVVYIDEVQGTVEAIGIWVITRIDANNFDLVGSTFTHAYTSGGIASKTQIILTDGYTFLSQANNKEYEIVCGYDSSTYFHVYVNDLDALSPLKGQWLELTRVLTCKISSISGQDITVGTIKDSLQNTYNAGTFFSTSELVGWVCWNTTRSQIVYVASMSSTTIFHVDTSVGPPGLNWQVNDNVVLFANNGWMQEFFTTTPTDPPTAVSLNFNLGTTPHIRWNSVEGQNKVNLFFGDSSTPPVMKVPLRIQRNAARSYFYDNAGVALRANIASGFYMEYGGGGGLCPYYSNSGTLQSPNTATTNATASIEDSSGNIWLKFVYGQTLNTVASTPTNFATYPSGLRVAMTVMYDDYQESDPVFRWYAAKADPATVYYFTFAAPTIFVDYGRMNKSITGIRFYCSTANATTVTSGWLDDDRTYQLFWEFFFDQNKYLKVDYTYGIYDAGIKWGANTISEWPNVLTNGLSPATPLTTFVGPSTLAGSIIRAADTTRAYVKPRYGARLGRSKGALSVIDRNDSTLSLSAYDGVGDNEDDNFPDLTVDNNNNRVEILLLGTTPLLGLSILNETILAFRTAELETYDLQSGIQRMIPVDCVAKRSIISTPYGVIWAAKSAIYLMPIGGSGIEILNADWQNYYNGVQLATDNVTPLMTATQRGGIVAGYDNSLHESWFNHQVNLAGGGTEYICSIYSHDKGQWRRRQLNNYSGSGQVTYFSRRRLDGTFTIANSSTINLYPTSSTTYLFEDDVRIDGSGAEHSQQKGVPVTLVFNCGSLYGIEEGFILDSILVDHQGVSSDVTKSFNLKLYANQESGAFDSKTILLDTATNGSQLKDRGVARRGLLQRLRVELSLPSGQEYYHKNWTVSKISIALVKRQRPGIL